MTDNVLVTFGTRSGSTVAVAEAIGQVLAARGFKVALKPVTDQPSLDGYQAAVIGSAIRMGAWLPETVQFVRDNQARLDEIPTAIFTVHLLNLGDDEVSRAARQAYTAPVRQLITPQAEGFFSGKMDYSRLSFIDHVLARAVEQKTNIGEADLRDWAKVRRWAQSILT